MAKSVSSAPVAPAAKAPAVNPFVAAVLTAARRPGAAAANLTAIAELLNGQNSVKAVAAALNAKGVTVTEGNVRAAVDTLRRKNGYGAVTRVGPGLFKLNAPATAPAAPAPAK